MKSPPATLRSTAPPTPPRDGIRKYWSNSEAARADKPPPKRAAGQKNPRGCGQPPKAARANELEFRQSPEALCRPTWPPATPAGRARPSPQIHGYGYALLQV